MLTLYISGLEDSARDRVSHVVWRVDHRSKFLGWDSDGETHEWELPDTPPDKATAFRLARAVVDALGGSATLVERNAASGGTERVAAHEFTAWQRIDIAMALIDSQSDSESERTTKELTECVR
jgi:hypothetical protein